MLPVVLTRPFWDFVRTGRIDSDIEEIAAKKKPPFTLTDFVEIKDSNFSLNFRDLTTFFARFDKSLNYYKVSYCLWYAPDQKITFVFKDLARYHDRLSKYYLTLCQIKNVALVAGIIAAIAPLFMKLKARFYVKAIIPLIFFGIYGWLRRQLEINHAYQAKMKELPLGLDEKISDYISQFFLERHEYAIKKIPPKTIPQEKLFSNNEQELLFLQKIANGSSTKNDVFKTSCLKEFFLKDTWTTLEGKNIKRCFMNIVCKEEFEVFCKGCFDLLGENTTVVKENITQTFLAPYSLIMFFSNDVMDELLVEIKMYLFNLSDSLKLKQEDKYKKDLKKNIAEKIGKIFKEHSVDMTNNDKYKKLLDDFIN